MTTPHVNPAFIGDDGIDDMGMPYKMKNSNSEPPPKEPKEREQWGKGVEFLMSCIAMSVGLGNVWRFPFTALDNGGGAFLIPYLVVLFLVGKPIYYLEMIIGQFSSRGSVKVFDLCPAMRGIGYGQAFMVFLLGTYYESICAIIGFYLVNSFMNPLPWAKCRPEWGDHCMDSAPKQQLGNGSLLKDGLNALTKLQRSTDIMEEELVGTSNRTISSSELYFVKEVLREKKNINDGIGLPNWELVFGLFVSWLCVFAIIIKGVRSSGKASYFLAIFPYVIMAVLLIRAVTLPGSLDGIIYFIKPDWSKILDPTVWYAAVTQCFYSLSVCFGNIIMYSSYNKFGHNVHRDATIVTGLDTCTSLLAGFTIFGILGHLAHEIGTDDIRSVVKGGAGLAFISYPDAIAKFQSLPQIFSVLFFLMLFVLGIGSNIAMTSCTVTAVRDYFPKVKQWQCALGIATVSFCIGLAYVTPGGQFILTLVDYFGASMIALFLGIAELYVLGWAYGVDRLCKDAEFMMGRKVGAYWRLCWGVVTPVIMTSILVYFLATYTPLKYNDAVYPSWAYGIGWTITSFGILQVPIWIVVGTIRAPGSSWTMKLKNAFKPTNDWGPSDPLLREQYNKEIANEAISNQNLGCLGYIRKNIFG
ncbi:sodium-dependent nutrient amino acid transporter 1 isoform X2 [Stomoxys calcitrans]|uniref:sodium-dependent nutrient amino acid transporter 1 isoform X2 n=1 Tax=Stomoxys calcitrans TaxID=35570 RepID=UPI0027E38CF9|nr:sodium-dependent nutrient amino acid transporter 1 isoform X2 [Stomoxys calcitrans]